MTRLRIAMVSEHASPLAIVGGVDAGGQNVHVAGLSAALADRGHDVVVYTRADQPGLPTRVRTESGVQVVHVMAGPPEHVAKDDLLPHMDAFAEGLTACWEVDPPDVVHGHYWMSGLAALDAAGTSRAPVVQTFHALGTVKQRWQGSQDTSPVARLELERSVAVRADRIIATCTDEVAELSAMEVPTEHVDVVPCGVDVSLFNPAELNPAELNPAELRTAEGTGRTSARTARLLIVGRLVPRKGIEDAIKALSLLEGAELVIVGGPAAAELDRDPEVARLGKVIADCGVVGRVQLTGHLGREALPAMIRSCDVLLAVPWYEPFGITALEAMACGVPVVASAVGGMLDTVVPGVTGLLAEARDPHSIAAATRALLSDEPLRTAMGQAGAERVRSLYSWQRVAERTEETYLKVLQTRPALIRLEV